MKTGIAFWMREFCWTQYRRVGVAVPKEKLRERVRKLADVLLEAKSYTPAWSDKGPLPCHAGGGLATPCLATASPVKQNPCLSVAESAGSNRGWLRRPPGDGSLLSTESSARLHLARPPQAMKPGFTEAPRHDMIYVKAQLCSIPEGATVKDLLALLEISESQGAVVIMEGRILKADDKMRCGVPVNVLQAIYGG
jgi:sulfur carrier protein ThiS